MTRRTALATGLAALALGGLGGIGIAAAQPAADANPSPDAPRSSEHVSMPGDTGRLHRRMAEHHRDMMRDPEMRELMRSPEMRTTHRDMMRMHGGMMNMPDMGMMD
jgi:hypothetical protein